MNVFKFGGASINSIERIENVGKIIKSFGSEKILIIISAMGKTTNALEKVVDAFFAGNQKEALDLFEAIKNEHNYVLQQLIKKESSSLKDFYTEIEWLLHDKPVRAYDYYYDQIVCCGELLSTALVSAYFNEIEITNNWVDVRDILRTDNNFRDAIVDWDFTKTKITETIVPLFEKTNLVLTQGFIGATDENESTTLGREGSDYSAAIFANMLNAKSLTIWKDVEGVMNADPKEFADAQIIKYLSYNEVIEMAYYGAQVIHPKTIKPLQNKQIPLYVKCFLNKDLPGTTIDNKVAHNLPPIIVVKQQQVLLQLSSKDFSFVGEAYVSKLYELFAALKIKPNLTQNGAISILCCLDDKPDKIEKLALSAAEYFDVLVEKNLTLLTIRYYSKEKFDELTKDKKILLTQQTTETIQALLH
jgi:aspartate kinase